MILLTLFYLRANTLTSEQVKNLFSFTLVWLSLTFLLLALACIFVPLVSFFTVFYHFAFESSWITSFFALTSCRIPCFTDNTHNVIDTYLRTVFRLSRWVLTTACSLIEILVFRTGNWITYRCYILITDWLTLTSCWIPLFTNNTQNGIDTKSWRSFTFTSFFTLYLPIWT